MERDEKSAAAAEAEAALGLNPRLFVNEVLNMVDDVRREAFEYCVQEGVSEAIGAAAATQRAEELERGVNDIHFLVRDVLDKRMTSWEKYSLRHCFTVPASFMSPEDDNSSAKESHKDRNTDPSLDVELDSLRRKIESANRESEELEREISSLERQTAYKRKLNSSRSEVLKLFEDEAVQNKIQGRTTRQSGRRSGVMEHGFDPISCDNIVDQTVNETTRAIWSVPDEEAFCTICVELLEEGHI